MAYRTEPLPTGGSEIYPGPLGTIRIPASLLPGGPQLYSGGPKRMMTGEFGRLAAQPHGSAPLPSNVPFGTPVTNVPLLPNGRRPETF